MGTEAGAVGGVRGEGFEQRRTSFGAAVRAAEYDAVRPGYPAEVARWLVGAPSCQLRVLDLGAGTGLLTRPLVETGHDVVAVDPSEAMLAVLHERSPQVRTAVGTAEQIPVDDASVDAVTVAHAWHWFDPARAAAEVARVLRPGGVLGVVWNVREGRVPWVAELDAIAGGGTAGDSDTRDWAGWPEVPDPFGSGERQLFRTEHVLEVDRLRDLAATWSTVQSREDRNEVLERVGELAHRTAGGRRELALPHLCRCYRYRYGSGSGPPRG